MELTERNLIPGDKIYRIANNRITDIIIIERITKTKAMSSRYKFQLKLKSFENKIKPVKVGHNDRNANYFMATEQLDEKFTRQKLIEELPKIDYSKYNTATLISINNMLSDPNTKVNYSTK